MVDRGLRARRQLRHRRGRLPCATTQGRRASACRQAATEHPVRSVAAPGSYSQRPTDHDPAQARTCDSIARGCAACHRCHLTPPHPPAAVDSAAAAVVHRPAGSSRSLALVAREGRQVVRAATTGAGARLWKHAVDAGGKRRQPGGLAGWRAGGLAGSPLSVRRCSGERGAPRCTRMHGWGRVRGVIPMRSSGQCRVFAANRICKETMEPPRNGKEFQ